MTGYEKLFQNEQEWVTDIGAWFPGERVVLRGKDMFTELKDMPWMGLLLYSITGHVFNDNQIKLFEGIWVISTSYPDPRLWNNRIATLAGTTRSTGALGISAGIAISEAIIYGSRPIVGSFYFLQDVKCRVDKGECISEVIKQIYQESKNKPRLSGSGLNRKIAAIPGYGRPVTDMDERILHLINFAGELGYAHGDYVDLAFKIDKSLLKHNYGLRMNVGALMAALIADQGFTANQLYYYCILCFTGGMFPCYVDALSKPEGAFFPLRCERIQYEGKPKRKWGDK